MSPESANSVQPASLKTVSVWILFIILGALAYQVRHLERFPQSLWETVLLSVGMALGIFILLADSQWGWQYYLEKIDKNSYLVTRSIAVVFASIVLHFYALTSTASTLAVGLSWSLFMGVWLEIWMHRREKEWVFARLGMANVLISEKSWSYILAGSWLLVIFLSGLVIL